jgi:hypothetical protein
MTKNRRLSLAWGEMTGMGDMGTPPNQPHATKSADVCDDRADADAVA